MLRIASICALALLGANLLAEDVPVFDRGEKYDLEHHQDYKLPDEKKSKEKDRERSKKAVETWIKNLKDPDQDVRKTACDMLALLSPPDAVPPLIEMLKPAKNEPISVALAANGALVKITGQNFGYKNYDAWMGWWTKNHVEFLKKAETGVTSNSKIAAEAANTLGLRLLDLGEYSSAEKQFLDAVSHDPTVPDYRNNLGNALREQGRYLDAIEYYNETIGINADLPQPYMNIGVCYSRMGKSIEAQSKFKEAIAKDKNGNLWELPWMIGKEHMRRAEWSLAYEFLDQARTKMEKRNLHDPRVYIDLAITHYGLDQFHSAWKELVNVRTLGYEPNAGLIAKVRKALKDQGVDPDAEDKEARDALARQVREDSGEPPVKQQITADKSGDTGTPKQ